MAQQATFGPITNATGNLMVNLYPAGPPSWDIGTGRLTLSSPNVTATVSVNLPGGVNRYCRNAKNQLVPIAEGLPRTEPEGYLIESYSTNQLLWSNTFSNGIWVPTNCALTQNAQSPEFSTNTNAWAVNVGTALGTHGFIQTFTKGDPNGVQQVTSCDYIYSLYVRSGGCPWMVIGNTGWTSWQIFNLLTGARGPASDIGTFGLVYTNTANGFSRFSTKLVTNSNASDDFRVFFGDTQAQVTPSGGVLPSWTGQGQQVFIWQAQAEANEGNNLPLMKCTSPIVTTSARNYRAEDILVLSNPLQTNNELDAQVNMRPADDDNTSTTLVTNLGTMGPAASAGSITVSISRPIFNVATYSNPGANVNSAGYLGQPGGRGMGPGVHSHGWRVDAPGKIPLALFQFSDAQSSQATGGDEYPADTYPFPAGFGNSNITFRSSQTWMSDYRAGQQAQVIRDLSTNTDLGTGFKVACLGDLNTVGQTSQVRPWPMTFNFKQQTKRAVYNLGGEAGVAQQLLAQTIQPFVLNRNFTHAIMYIGAVDILSNQTDTQVIGNWTSCANAIRNAGITLIALNQNAWANVGSWTGLMTTYLNNLNAAIQSYCTTNSVTFVDVQSQLWDPANHNQLNPVLSYPPDRTNLIQPGLDIVAQAVLGVLP